MIITINPSNPSRPNRTVSIFINCSCVTDVPIMNKIANGRIQKAIIIQIV